MFRSIKLGEVGYDSAPSTPHHRDKVGNGHVGGAGGGARARERGASVDGDTSVMRADRWAGHRAHGAELYPLSAAVRRAASPCMTRSR